MGINAKCKLTSSSPVWRNYAAYYGTVEGANFFLKKYQTAILIIWKAHNYLYEK
jgi:hypothetical protein